MEIREGRADLGEWYLPMFSTYIRYKTIVPLCFEHSDDSLHGGLVAVHSMLLMQTARGAVVRQTNYWGGSW